jgi:hypothetical protein
LTASARDRLSLPMRADRSSTGINAGAGAGAGAGAETGTNAGTENGRNSAGFVVGMGIKGRLLFVSPAAEWSILFLSSLRVSMLITS